MSENKRYKNKLSRFDAEREELKSDCSRVKEKAERAEIEPTEYNESDGGIKYGESYIPSIDTEMLEDFLKAKRRRKKGKLKDLFTALIVAFAMFAGFICLFFSLQLIAVIIVVAGVGFAIIICIPNFLPVKSDKKNKRGSKLKKRKDRQLSDRIKDTLKYDGEVTAAKITAYENLSGESKKNKHNIKCKIEYTYCDKNKITRYGCYNGEIPPLLWDTFKAEGILPILFIKGTSRILTHFPRRLGES